MKPLEGRRTDGNYEQGEFRPLGAIMHSDGAIQWIAADSGEDFPDAQTLIDMMRGLIKDKAAALEIRSAVICYDCLTLPPGHYRQN